jgi:hypothetical protein
MQISQEQLLRKVQQLLLIQSYSYKELIAYGKYIEANNKEISEREKFQEYIDYIAFLDFAKSKGLYQKLYSSNLDTNSLGKDLKNKSRSRGLWIDVVDRKTKLPIKDVLISINNIELKFEQGMSVDKGERYTIKVQKSGYKTFRKSYKVDSDPERIKIELEPR